MVEPTKKKRKRRKDKEELELEEFLFGSSSQIDSKNNDRDVGLQISKSLNALSDEKQRDEAKNVSNIMKDKQLKPAWVDEHDASVTVDVAAIPRLRKLRKTEAEKKMSGVEYEKRLRAQFEDINRGNDISWAALPENKDDEDPAFSLLRGTKGLLGNGNRVLPSKELKITRAKDANMTGRSDAVVRSTRFHPNGSVILTAGFDKTLRLFNIDGLRNPRILSLSFESFPIYNADFTADGYEVLCTSKRPYFFSVDVRTGKTTRIRGIKGRRDKSYEYFAMDRSLGSPYIAVVGAEGYIYMLSQKTKQMVFTLKCNSHVTSCSFSGDGNTLYSMCASGELYKWDVRKRRCIGRYQDEGSIRGTSVACSHDGSLLACGSSSGVANLYVSKEMSMAGQTPKPNKAFLNLTTSIDMLKYNSDGQILAMASSRSKDALRLIHVPSRTVFSNWPTQKTPLNFVSSIDFSPNSGYFAVGNVKGKVLLYRLNHYSTS